LRRGRVRGGVRHALAQALVDTAGLKVAQEVLGHANVSATARSYARVDVGRDGRRARGRARGPRRRPVTAVSAAAGDDGDGYVFAYDTLAELDQAADRAR
jgi:hypothetical protein